MYQIPNIEINVVKILNNAFKYGHSADRHNANDFCGVVEGMMKNSNYFQTQLIDGTGSGFILQPCDVSGRPTSRFIFSYANCLNSGGGNLVYESDTDSIPVSKSTTKPKSVSIWKKIKRAFGCKIKNKK